MEIFQHLPAPKKRFLISLISFLSLAFLLLAWFVAKYPPSSVDIAVSAAVQKKHTLFVDKVMTLISWAGFAPISFTMVLITSGFFYLLKYSRTAVFTLLTLTSGLISSVVKIAVGRPRPTSELVRIVEIARHESFPSGHTLFCTIFFGFLIVAMVHLKTILYPLRIIISGFAVFMILATPVSRIYLGAHWFTDVTGGLLLGINCVIILGYFYLRPYLSTARGGNAI